MAVSVIAPIGVHFSDAARGAVQNVNDLTQLHCSSVGKRLALGLR